MALTTSERLTVDGVDLKTYAKNVPSLAATLSVPGRRGSNVPTAGRSGALWTPLKPFEEGRLILPMWVRGTDDDGHLPEGSTPRREFYRRVDELSALFTKSHSLLTIAHTLADGSVRQIAAECVAAHNWTVQGPDPLGRIDFELVTPDPFWSSATPFSVTMNPDVQTDFGGGATAPLEDAVITIVGPISNPLVWDRVSGAYIRYGAMVAAGQTVTLNAATWKMTTTGGASANYGLLNFSGSGGKLIRFAPDNVTRAYRTELQGSAKTSATKLTIAGRVKYLNG